MKFIFGFIDMSFKRLLRHGNNVNKVLLFFISTVQSAFAKYIGNNDSTCSYQGSAIECK